MVVIVSALALHGCIIIPDLISGEQTGLNVGKTVFHFFSRDSSSLGSAFC